MAHPPSARHRASLLVGLLGTLCAAGVAAAPRQLRLSVVDDPRTTMGIAWTGDADEASVVQYGPSDSYGAEASGAGPILVDSIGYVHEVTLTGLQPGATYHYRVGDGVAWSDDATFETAPDDPCLPWRFAAMGDDRSQFGTGSHPGVDDSFRDILLEGAAHGPALILNSGDLVEDGTVAAQWDDYLTETDVVARQIPMLPTIGNHDDDTDDGDSAKYNRLFHLPRNPVTGTEDYYYVRYRNALFAVLSSTTFKGGSAGDERTFAQQGEWLDQVLSDHADATWKIVCLHHPPFTGGGFDVFGFGLIGHPANEAETNEVLLPILDRHHVDFVISGHNHWYERFLPLVQGDQLDVGEVSPSPDDGTIYITTGGAGAYTMEFDWIPLLDVCRGDVDGTRAACSGVHHYVVFDIHDRRLSMETWSTRCQNVDCDNEPELIDSLTYTKGGASTCPPQPDGGPVADAAASADAALADAGERPDAARADQGVERDATRHDAVVGQDFERADTAPTPTDAASGVEAAVVAPDAAEPSTTSTEGCGCRARGGGAGWGVLALLVALGAWVRRRSGAAT